VWPFASAQVERREKYQDFPDCRSRTRFAIVTVGVLSKSYSNVHVLNVDEHERPLLTPDIIRSRRSVDRQRHRCNSCKGQMYV
jgi:hypothetical protein